MRLIILALAVVMIKLSLAEPVTANKVVLCDTKITVFAAIIYEFKQLPVWRGKSTSFDSELVLAVHPENYSWTLLEYQDDWACVLSVGRDSQTRQMLERTLVNPGTRP